MVKQQKAVTGSTPVRSIVKRDLTVYSSNSTELKTFLV